MHADFFLDIGFVSFLLVHEKKKSASSDWFFSWVGLILICRCEIQGSLVEPQQSWARPPGDQGQYPVNLTLNQASQARADSSQGPTRPTAPSEQLLIHHRILSTPDPCSPWRQHDETWGVTSCPHCWMGGSNRAHQLKLLLIKWSFEPE